MAIQIGDVVYRNLQEQVGKNKEDIESFKKGQRVLSQFGIKVVGHVDQAIDIPTVDVYKESNPNWDYGDAYSVGTTTPYDMWLLTRADQETTTDYWFNIGRFPAPGPTGATGPQGETGPQGPQGPKGDSAFVVTIKGEIANVSELPTASASTVHDGYIWYDTDGDSNLYVTYDEDGLYSWHNVGAIAFGGDYVSQAAYDSDKQSIPNNVVLSSDTIKLSSPGGLIGTGIDTVLEIEAPTTATSGTLTTAQLQALQTNSMLRIKLNNEYYYLNDEESTSGMIVYSHTGYDTSGKDKYLAITVSTLGWTLTTTEVGGGSTELYRHTIQYSFGLDRPERVVQGNTLHYVKIEFYFDIPQSTAITPLTLQNIFKTVAEYKGISTTPQLRSYINFYEGVIKLYKNSSIDNAAQFGAISQMTTNIYYYETGDSVIHISPNFISYTSGSKAYLNSFTYNLGDEESETNIIYVTAPYKVK